MRYSVKAVPNEPNVPKEIVPQEKSSTICPCCNVDIERIVSPGFAPPNYDKKKDLKWVADTYGRFQLEDPTSELSIGYWHCIDSLGNAKPLLYKKGFLNRNPKKKNQHVFYWDPNINPYKDEEEELGKCHSYFGKIFQQFTLVFKVLKIQQTKMLVRCQRVGNLFLFGLIWQYFLVQTKYNKAHCLRKK